MASVLRILFVGMLINIQHTFSQNNLYVGSHRFDANYTWPFTINGGWIQGDGEVTFAKHGSGGMLMLAVKDFNGNIKGDIYIYLQDGSAIKCVDRSIKDNVDHYSMSLYYLTNVEVEKIKKSNIHDIRFAIYKYPFGSTSYTMSNQYTNYGDPYNTQTNQTAIEIEILMNKD